jgi:peptide/nickel transport system permease protein
MASSVLQPTATTRAAATTTRRDTRWVRRASPMARLVAGRLVRLVIVLLLVSFATLKLLDLLPGGPVEAILGESATPEQVAVVEQRLGLDRPFVERYGDWVGGIVTGDLGRSTFTSEPVSDVLLRRLPVTIELALGTLLVSLLVAVPAALYAASRPGGVFDRAVAFIGSAILSVPGFIMGVLLIYFLAVSFEVFPVLGWVPISENLGQNLRHATLPILSLALLEASVLTRILRNDLVTTMQEDFVLAARARGLPRRRVLFAHALRPSCFSLVTVAGVSLGRLLGGTVIVETLYGLPGLGQAAIQAINTRDFLVLRGVILVMSVGYVIVGMLVDLTYPLLDPRVRAGGDR